MQVIEELDVIILWKYKGPTWTGFDWFHLLSFQNGERHTRI
jgi:hypothetical protein